MCLCLVTCTAQLVIICCTPFVLHCCTLSRTSHDAVKTTFFSTDCTLPAGRERAHDSQKGGRNIAIHHQERPGCIWNCGGSWSQPFIPEDAAWQKVVHMSTDHAASLLAMHISGTP